MVVIHTFPPPDIVAKTWRISVSSIKPMHVGHDAQANVRLENGRFFVLKRVRRDELTPSQVESVLESVHTAENKYGIDVAAPLPTRKDAGFLLKWGDQHYYLARYLEGDRPSYKNPADVADVLRALAQLHKKCGGLGRNLSTKLNISKTVSLDKEFEAVAEIMDEVVDEVMNFKGNALAAKALSAPLEDVQENISRARSIITNAINKGIDFSDSRTLCHGDTHENNYLLRSRTESPHDENKSRICCLLDIESFDPRSCAEDLIAPLHSLGFYSSWSRNAIEHALGAYDSVHAPSPGERAFLLAHLSLPRKWFRSTRSLLKRNGRFHHVRFWTKWYRRSDRLKRQRACVEELINSDYFK